MLGYLTIDAYLLYSKIQMASTLISAQELVEQFVETVRALPQVTNQSDTEPVSLRFAEPSRQYDAQVALRLPGKTITLLIEAKTILYPRDARLVLWRLQEFIDRWNRKPNTHQVVPVLIADSISPGAKELLRDERAGYFDSGGSLFLVASGIYVYVDKPAPKRASRLIRSLFSERRAQVLHAMLARHEGPFEVTALAGEAQVSPATASQVLQELERFEWVVSRGRGPNKVRYLREPAALLDAWAKQAAAMPAPTMRRFYVPLTRADELVERMGRTLAGHAVEYEITHAAAGQRYAPFLSNVPRVHCRLLAGRKADRAVGELGVRVVSQGTNLAVIEAKSPGELLFRQRLNGIWLASPIQVYLDLLRSAGRAKEMAEHLRRERIGF